MKAVLLLEDGTFFMGKATGKSGETFGEVVFNTCMSGYQEIATDPSYCGQIVVMTYPLIGNYGFNEEDVESYKAHLEGFVAREFCDKPSNWRCNMHTQEYFVQKGITAIEGIDTRELTQHIRKYGSMFGMISTESGNLDILMTRLKKEKTVKRNLVQEVTSKLPTHKLGNGKNIVVVDFGVKYNIIRFLEKRGCNVHVLPAFSTVDDIMNCRPDGILLSNGPGDPMDNPSIIDQVKDLIGKKPILGICLGHQILALALGGRTYKLKFGHHGGNHPVKDLTTGKCFITSQNHNYAVDTFENEEIVITHVNVNDSTVEGFRHKRYPIISVQYHPEAAPGPKDSAYIFDEFEKLC